MDSPTGAPLAIPFGDDFPDIRVAVRRICDGFPGSYWRRCEEKQDYPSDFVEVLIKAGYLGALIPEEYGGAGLSLRAAAVILEEIHASGCNAGACHAQIYIMGTLLRHGSTEQKRRYLPKIASGDLRLQAFGVTEPSTGSDTLKLKTRAEKRGAV
ncbi:MAG TPA: acyl-CoA dehydrogenase family protein, partial [Stellaceae bacterium]|nr:acyl-CoA dehydrogenase family protein [Stellaceae bacterium]